MKFRNKRVSEAIKTAVSEIFQYEFKDPRLPEIITITGVDLSPDLQHAKIYFTQIPDGDEAIDETLDVIDGAIGFIRGELGNRLDLRYTPEIVFYYDDSVEEADKIERLIEESKKSMGESGKTDPDL